MPRDSLDQFGPETRGRKNWTMIKNLKELWSYRELVYNLVMRDLKVRYKNSLLGVFWSWLKPAVDDADFHLCIWLSAAE